MNDKPPSRVAVIINPISGTGGRPRRRARAGGAGGGPARGRAASSRRSSSRSAPGTPASWRARRWPAASSLVIAWGGDGTVNEVASALAFRDATLGVIPSGSGNGLARELGIPLEPERAFAVAFEGTDARDGRRRARRAPVLQHRRPRPRRPRRARVRGRTGWSVAASRDTSRSPRASCSPTARRAHDRHRRRDRCACGRCSSRSPTRASTATAP